jgi:hypothetical protein
MKDQIAALLLRQKLQDEEDKKNIENNNKHLERIENVIENVTKKKEIINSFPNEPVFLGPEETTERNIPKRVLSDKIKFNELVSLKPTTEIHYYQTNMFVTIPLQPVIIIKYYKTNMFLTINIEAIQYYQTNMVIEISTN